MKIYFEDGELLPVKRLSFKYDCKIDAKYGYSYCVKHLDALLNMGRSEMVIYTNSLIALDNQYAWNDELNVPEIYIRAGEHMVFTRIDELTTREFKARHDIMAMYIANEFGNL